MTSIVIAPNAFKGSLTAIEAAAAMSAAAAVVFPTAELVLRPLADGGDGSVDVLLMAGFSRREVTVRLPDGRMGAAPIAVRADLAVVELANTCGLVLTPSSARQPLTANTLGVADAVRGALDTGCSRVVICVGGSASTDGGVGLLCGLGGRVRDDDGSDVRPGGQWLSTISSIDLSGLDSRLNDVDLQVATDVTSPLYGPDGAAFVFAPQKGATPTEVAQLDDGLRSWASVVAHHTGRDLSDEPGAGAAGGTAFAATTLLGARVIAGAEFIADAIGLDAALASSSLLVSGEGSLDQQSLLGKGPVHAAELARARGVPTVLVCGRLDVSGATLRELGVVSSGSLVDIATPAEAMENAAALLARRTVEVLAAARESVT